MIRAARIAAAAIVATLVATACGGAATAPSPTTPATTAPTIAATSTPAPTAAATASASPAPAFAGVGSASTKLSEVTTTKSAPVHFGFFGDEAALPAGKYMETLSLVTLQPGGRTVSHKHGGLEIVVVIEGSVEVNMGAAGKALLTAGQTAKVPANTPLQALNHGTDVAKFLAFFLTADGQPFQTNLTAVP
ncbi:MAG TPA: cupin domain-containing protein [Candidatus Limnocylindria bacterium]|nr:cupin domain-containing protein [Candidatus Limnocylindria bacterium]